MTVLGLHDSAVVGIRSRKFWDSDAFFLMIANDLPHNSAFTDTRTSAAWAWIGDLYWPLNKSSVSDSESFSDSPDSDGGSCWAVACLAFVLPRFVPPVSVSDSSSESSSSARGALADRLLARCSYFSFFPTFRIGCVLRLDHGRRSLASGWSGRRRKCCGVPRHQLVKQFLLCGSFRKGLLSKN